MTKLVTIIFLVAVGMACGKPNPKPKPKASSDIVYPAEYSYILTNLLRESSFDNPLYTGYSAPRSYPRYYPGIWWAKSRWHYGHHPTLVYNNGYNDILDQTLYGHSILYYDD
ncbi:UNVERIFIED_CONTAM: hypothetical protein RMT77_005779 [Armadillidium vulgare]|nr:hypothetical protein Avbf_08108 [Armadillidium vulgare]